MNGVAVIDPAFRALNYAEAALWGVIGVGFLVSAWRGRAGRRSKLIAAVAFVLFGISDLVEAGTGAWWRPWWLLVWKGACVAGFVALFIYYVVKIRPRRGGTR